MKYKNRLEDIDKLKIELDNLRPLTKENILELREYYKIGLTYSSNAIEGSTLDIIETKIIIEDGITINGKSVKEHLEVLGHSEAYDFIYTLLENKYITENDIKNIHKLLYYHIDMNEAGNYRTKQVYIHGVKYIPPKASKIDDLMSKSIEKINKLYGTIHDIELACIIHTDLVNIHPFIDGNGRTARLLMNLHLIKSGYPITIIPPVIRNDYMQSVKKTNDNDTLYFINFISNMVYESMKDYIRMFN